MTRGSAILLGALVGATLAFDAPLLAQDQTPSARGWRVQGEGGQAFAPASQRFAEFAGAGLARDFRLVSHLGGAVELYPLLAIHQTREDHLSRETVPAVAAALLVTFTIGPPAGAWNVRMDAGSGLFYATHRVPAQGSRANFFDQGGLWLLHRLASGRRVRAGYRYVHISNLSLLGDINPGLTFHALALGLDL
ncbi:MAG: acyloxyacyl hydrolase [Thermoanaerobaculia bacterium]